jgi:RNA polymerase sigma factor (sigma-70 family)
MPRSHLYLTHAPLIERALLFTARRHRCSADEAEDFAAWARLKFVENDYAALAAFEGRSGMGSYLAVVVQRLFLDYRIAKWGRFRPSAEGKRLGPLAVRLETLLYRDGLSLDEAYQTLRAVDPELRREVLEDLQARLPVRVAPRFEGEEALASVAAAEAAPEELAIAKEEAARKRRASAALGETIAAFEPQDQIILRLRFAEGRQIAEIARVLHLDARFLYRRIERLVAELRRRLGERGVSGDDFGWNTAGAAEEPGESAGSVFSRGKRAPHDRL